MTQERRILVVDDDDAIRALVQTVLRRRGLRVDVARNGIEAMDRIRICRYSLVVLDLMMPMMSGYEVLDQLGALGQPLRPLVLVLTAGLEPRTFDTSYVIGTIHKPFDIELLLDTVMGVLRGTAAAAQHAVDCPPQPETSAEEPN
ncbi:MAG TPA: response regulator [Thermoanaerobaculia bacterium]